MLKKTQRSLKNKMEQMPEIKKFRPNKEEKNPSLADLSLQSNSEVFISTMPVPENVENESYVNEDSDKELTHAESHKIIFEAITDNNKDVLSENKDGNIRYVMKLFLSKGFVKPALNYCLYCL